MSFVQKQRKRRISAPSCRDQCGALLHRIHMHIIYLSLAVVGFIWPSNFNPTSFTWLPGGCTKGETAVVVHKWNGSPPSFSRVLWLCFLSGLRIYDRLILSLWQSCWYFYYYDVLLSANSRNNKVNNNTHQSATFTSPHTRSQAFFLFVQLVFARWLESFLAILLLLTLGGWVAEVMLISVLSWSDVNMVTT